MSARFQMLNARRRWRFRSLSGGCVLAWFACVTGCPDHPKPTGSPSRLPAGAVSQPQSERTSLQPADLLGTWEGRVWQVRPGGPWQEAEAARFSFAASESRPGERRQLSVPQERLDQSPSVSIRLTVQDQHVATPGLEGALVRLTYFPAGASDPAGPDRTFLFRREGSGTLLLERGGDRLTVESLGDDRLGLRASITAIEGHLLTPSTFEVMLVRQPATPE